MANFAKKVFRKEAAIREKFTWQRILVLVGQPDGGGGTPTLTELEVKLEDGNTLMPITNPPTAGKATILATGAADDTDDQAIAEFELQIEEDLTSDILGEADGYQSNTTPAVGIKVGETTSITIKLFPEA